MNYSYNYAYLQEFMQSHHLQKKDLLEALGCSDYTSLNKWLSGKVPVHVTAMLRFCNYYNTPLADFFVDEDGLPCDFEPRMPSDNAQLLPTGGYGMRDGRGRGIVETKITDRSIRSFEQQNAVEEGILRKDEQLSKREALLAGGMMQNARVVGSGTSEHNPEQATSEAILTAENENVEEIRRLEKMQRAKVDEIRERYDKEREILLAIIEQQQKDISSLLRQRL